jgi:hypothetical protein
MVRLGGNPIDVAKPGETQIRALATLCLIEAVLILIELR